MTISISSKGNFKDKTKVIVIIAEVKEVLKNLSNFTNGRNIRQSGTFRQIFK